MDRSFLSNGKVIEAAQKFVCIRLATYEDKEEAKFLKNIHRGRSGELENTVFVMLSPDGKEQLCRAGRGPNFEFGNPSDLAREMNQIAKRYTPAKSPNVESVTLPQMKNVRLAINVAACDGLPAVIVYSSEKDQLEIMKSKLAGVAVRAELAGKFIFGSTTQSKDLEPIEELGETVDSGYLVVMPDDYGLSAEIIWQFQAKSEPSQLKEQLLKIAGETSKKSKVHHKHVRDGRNNHKTWETEIPVTDPMARRAMNRKK